MLLNDAEVSGSLLNLNIREERIRRLSCSHFSALVFFNYVEAAAKFLPYLISIYEHIISTHLVRETFLTFVQTSAM